VLLIVLVVVIPAILIGFAVMHESLTLYQRVTSGDIDVQKPIRLLERSLPVLGDYLETFGIELGRLKQGMAKAAMTASQFVATHLVSIGQNAVRFVAMILIMVYLLFYFFRDGERLLQLIVGAVPLGDERERKLFERFAEVSRATMKGTVLVGLAQGFLGGLLFWAVGIEAAVFWGVVMTVLSFLPVFGASLIWIPAAIILMATGSLIKGIVLLAAGVVLISLADNLLRPILVGRETRLPDYIILVSTLGGISLFGISGLVIGPVLAALFLTIWEMFAQEFCEEKAGSAEEPASQEAGEA
jgi:predicted PurR-regulated permease PerM